MWFHPCKSSTTKTLHNERFHHASEKWFESAEASDVAIVTEFVVVGLCRSAPQVDELKNVRRAPKIQIFESESATHREPQTL
jgi:hypothetical protein